MFRVQQSQTLPTILDGALSRLGFAASGEVQREGTMHTKYVSRAAAPETNIVATEKPAKATTRRRRRPLRFVSPAGSSMRATWY